MGLGFGLQRVLVRASRKEDVLLRGVRVDLCLGLGLGVGFGVGKGLGLRLRVRRKGISEL